MTGLRSRARFTAAAMALVLLAGCGGSDDGAPVVAGEQARLAGAILSQDWNAQKKATREVLASIGVEVLDADARFPDGDGPYVIEPELLMLAQDGARKPSSARVTLADVATMLGDFGFPFQGTDHIGLLEDGVRAWVVEALEDPDAPGANAARFLHAMAARQQPAIDLASPDWTGQQYTLTHLELFVFTVAVGNAFPDGTRQATARRFDPVGGLLGLAIPEARANTPLTAQCALTADYYGPPGRYDRNKKNMGNIFNGGVGAGGNAEGAFGGAAKAASALSTLFKLHKLMLLYSSIDMRLAADPPMLHKAADGEPDAEVEFLATVGVDEEKYREFVEKMNSSDIGKNITECLSSLGLPNPTDLGDVVEEMRNWDVSWDLYGDHATWSSKKNRFSHRGQRRAPLEPISKTRAGSRFVVDIKREKHHEGEIVTGYITARATLHTDAMPGTELAGNYAAAIGALGDGNVIAGLLGIAGNTVGLTGSLMAEVLGGWAQRLLDPDVANTVAVTYHEHRFPDYSYEGTLSARTQHAEHESWERLERQGASSYRPKTQHDRELQQNAQLQLKLRPNRMSYTRYTERKDTAYWDMAAEGTASGSYRRVYSVTGERGCAGRNDGGDGYTGRMGVNNLAWAYGSTSYPVSRSRLVKLEQDGSVDSGYRIELVVQDMGVSVRVDARTSQADGPDGCEFVGAVTSSTHSVQVPGIPMKGFSESFHVPEPYPESISGTREVENPDGSVTHWQWNLQRVGPFEGATGKPANAGGG